MIGVIGGMGPLATADFLNKVIGSTSAEDDAEHVPMLISCDPRIPPRPAAILHGSESPLPRLREIRDRLIAGGATTLVMPCNTAHYWYDELVADCPVPFLSIVEAGCDAAARIARPGSAVVVAATRATLRSQLYEAALAQRGLSALLPTDAELDELLLPAIAHVKAGRVASSGPLALRALDSFARRGATCALLACTELPVALGAANEHPRIECIDATLELARQTVRHWQGAPQTAPHGRARAP